MIVKLENGPYNMKLATEKTKTIVIAKESIRYKW